MNNETTLANNRRTTSQNIHMSCYAYSFTVSIETGVDGSFRWSQDNTLST
jgi:hypothetical protein